MGRDGLDRRAFLRRTAAVALSGAALGDGRQVFGQAPAIVTAEAARPSVEHGVTAGDVDGDRAMIWSRTDRPARLVVEYSTAGSFADMSRVVGPAALETSDFTARVDLSGLRPGQRIFYRARFQSLQDLRVWSEPIAGTFTTPPSAAAPRDVTIAWTADTVGQGWGINAGHGRHAALRRDAHR